MEISLDLINGTAKFNITVINELDYETYTGVFEVRTAMSALQTVQADERYRRLLGDNLQFATPKALQIAFSLSQLSQRVISAPSWWDSSIIPGGHLAENVIVEVLTYAVEAEKQYRDAKMKKLDEIKKELIDKIKSGEIVKEEPLPPSNQ